MIDFFLARQVQKLAQAEQHFIAQAEQHFIVQAEQHFTTRTYGFPLMISNDVNSDVGLRPVSFVRAFLL